MATSKQELEALINAQITDNGTNAITGPMLNDILQKLLTLVPAQTFSFPKAASVTLDDVGKLMINVDGEAEVANPSGAYAGVKGEWTIEPTAGATPYSGWNYLNSSFFNFGHVYRNEDNEVININSYMNYSDIMSLSAPSGTVNGDYKYPADAAEYADNLLWAFNNATTTYTVDGGDYETGLLTDYFDVTRTGNLITLKQKKALGPPQLYTNYEGMAPTEKITSVEAKISTPAYMQYLILGVLDNVVGSNVEITNAEVIKLTLNKEVVFEEYNETNGTTPGNLVKRLLIPVAEGKVEPLIYNGQLNEQMPYYSYNDFTGPFDEYRKRGSFTIYEALEEGDIDEQILARRIKLVFSDIDSIIDDYGNVYGEYYY